MKETRELKSTFKKSELQAKTLYDYKKLEYSNDRFLDCKIVEKEETLEVDYDIQGRYPFEDIRRCPKQEKMRTLIDAALLVEYRDEYSFAISPENLYFDDNYRVSILHRDIQTAETIEVDDFLEEYKALIAYSVQKKYGYKDYLEGGIGLYKKNKFLKTLYPLETLEEVVSLLEEEFGRITEDIRESKLLVNKTMYRSGRMYIILSALLLTGCLFVIGYFYLLEKPIIEAKLKAEIDFLKSDYIQVIDDLSALPMEQLSYDQKYILSISFVNIESLTVEQKKNILEKLPINGEEKLMEYWIYIGRLNPLEAENIAMQRSDDELLLYAYMLDKDLTETDTQMTGEEKAAKLADLEAKIKALAEKYIVKEE